MSRTALHLFTAVLLVLSLGACGAVAGAPGASVTVHEQDAGHAYSIHVGDTLNVDLLDSFPVPGSSIVWNADTSDGTVLSRVSATRETPSGIAHRQAHYLATFKALKSGKAIIQMVGTARCEAMNPAFCPQPSGAVAVRID